MGRLPSPNRPARKNSGGQADLAQSPLMFPLFPSIPAAQPSGLFSKSKSSSPSVGSYPSSEFEETFDILETSSAAGAASGLNSDSQESGILNYMLGASSHTRTPAQNIPKPNAEQDSDQSQTQHSTLPKKTSPFGILSIGDPSKSDTLNNSKTTINKSLKPTDSSSTLREARQGKENALPDRDILANDDGMPDPRTAFINSNSKGSSNSNAKANHTPTDSPLYEASFPLVESPSLFMDEQDGPAINEEDISADYPEESSVVSPKPSSPATEAEEEKDDSSSFFRPSVQYDNIANGESLPQSPTDDWGTNEYFSPVAKAFKFNFQSHRHPLPETNSADKHITYLAPEHYKPVFVPTPTTKRLKLLPYLTYPVSPSSDLSLSKDKASFLFIGNFSTWMFQYQNIIRALDYAIQCVGPSNTVVPHPNALPSRSTRYLIQCDFYALEESEKRTSGDHSICRLVVTYSGKRIDSPYRLVAQTYVDRAKVKPLQPKSYDFAIASPNTESTGKEAALKKMCASNKIPVFAVATPFSTNLMSNPSIDDIRIGLVVEGDEPAFSSFRDQFRNVYHEAIRGIDVSALVSIPSLSLNRHLSYLTKATVNGYPRRIRRSVAIVKEGFENVLNFLPIRIHRGVEATTAAKETFCTKVRTACRQPCGSLTMNSIYVVLYSLLSLIVLALAFLCMTYVNQGILLSQQLIPEADGKILYPFGVYASSLKLTCPTGSLSARLNLCAPQEEVDLPSEHLQVLEAHNLIAPVVKVLDRKNAKHSDGAWNAYVLSRNSFLLVAHPATPWQDSWNMMRILSQSKPTVNENGFGKNQIERVRSYKSLPYNIVPVFGGVYVVTIHSKEQEQVLVTILDKDSVWSTNSNDYFFTIDMRTAEEIERAFSLSECPACHDFKWATNGIGNFLNDNWSKVSQTVQQVQEALMNGEMYSELGRKFAEFLNSGDVWDAFWAKHPRGSIKSVPKGQDTASFRAQFSRLAASNMGGFFPAWMEAGKERKKGKEEKGWGFDEFKAKDILKRASRNAKKVMNGSR